MTIKKSIEFFVDVIRDHYNQIAAPKNKNILQNYLSKKTKNFFKVF